MTLCVRLVRKSPIHDSVYRAPYSIVFEFQEQMSMGQSITKKKARFNFDFSACLGDDVTQNVSARHCARETQLLWFEHDN